MRLLILSGGGFLFAAPVILSGKEPVLTHVQPAGLQRGTETEVKLNGKFDPWPCNLWADDPGIVFTPGKDAGKTRVTVAAGVRPGPHLIRAFNGEGASAPVSVVIAERPQTLETEPNDDFRMPQELPGSTATCNGRLDKSDDVDSFAVTLRKDQVMVTRVEAAVLAAGFDAMLRIVDDNGTTLAFNHDYTSMDPLIVFTAPRDGRYVVQIMGHSYPASSDIRFAGGEDCIYRLHVSTEPCVRNTWPLAVTRGKNSCVALEGWNLLTKEVQIDGSVPVSFPVTFSEMPEVTETGESQKLEIPSAVSGRLNQPGQEDRYTFNGTKGTELEITVTGAAFGSLIDPRITVVRGDGKVVGNSDDASGALEPRFQWPVGTDGAFSVTVGDVPHRGGPDVYYRLQIRQAPPAATGSVSAHAFKVDRGKDTEIKVKVSTTNGYRSKLKLVAMDLPEGVTAAEVEVPEKGGEVGIKLTAGDEGPLSRPFRLVLREVEGGREIPVLYSIAATGDSNGVPQGFGQLLINQTDQLWLTVPPPPAK